MTNNVIEMKQQQDAPAPGLRSIREVIADLSRPIASKHLRSRTQGGKALTFIPWYFAVKYLDYYAPGWSYEIRSVVTVGDAVAVTARITIPAAEGNIHREAIGYEPLAVKGYGDPTSNASSMALRRAAALFGLCAYLYEK